MIAVDREAIQVMYKRIIDWQMDVGESFTDYFMHDRVKDVSWGFWLLGKGYTKRANEILEEVQAGNKCLDQELLYHVHNEDDPNYYSHGYYQDIALWAEFLCSTRIYIDRVNEFFAEYD